TGLAKTNLLAECVREEKIIVTGNTVIDALLEIANYLQTNPAVIATMEKHFSFLDKKCKLLLVTSHRRENFGAGLMQVCHALLELASREDVQIVYPVHLNPNVLGPVHQLLGKQKNIHLLPPQDYLPFVYLMMRSYLIITDSGGIQEEAPSLGKPVLVVRETTERQEGIAAGTAKLVGTNQSSIVKHVEVLLDNSTLYETMSAALNPYGDGKAAERIMRKLQDECNL
ncbi:MAG: UDP-N-acetylglucosamine 2-epimerase, partial [uncultured bacterium]